MCKLSMYVSVCCSPVCVGVDGDDGSDDCDTDDYN